MKTEGICICLCSVWGLWNGILGLATTSSSGHCIARPFLHKSSTVTKDVSTNGRKLGQPLSTNSQPHSHSPSEEALEGANKCEAEGTNLR